MERNAKAIIWINISVMIFFILFYTNVEYLNNNFLQGVLSFIHETSILLIAAIVVFSLIYSVYVLFKPQTLEIKLMLSVVVLINVFLTFILPYLYKPSLLS